MDPRLLLNVASAAAGVFALCRLMYAGVHREFPWFSIYLGAAALQCFGWLAGGPRDYLYAIVWASSTAILLALRIVVVVELWHKLSHSAPGSLSRSFTVLILFLAVVVSAASGFDGLKLFGHSSQRLAFYAVSLASRYSSSSLCVICSALAIFAVMFPRNISKDAVRHALLLTFYFATLAAGFLVINYSRGSAPLVGAILAGSSAGLYVLWGLLLTGPRRHAAADVPALQAKLT